MIGKDCEKPLKLLMLEALNRRLPESHPVQTALTVDIQKNHAGYRGEKRVFSLLKALPEKEYLLFHDLRFPSIPYPFQIDILLVSSSFILILEVKNIIGDIYFDHIFGQLIRTKADGQKEAFDDPLMQADRHKTELKAWMKVKKLPDIPIETLVVSANSSAIVRASHRETQRKVIRKEQLLHKINELKRKYPDDVLHTRLRKRLATVLLKCHLPVSPKLLERYGISASSLKNGVFCPDCSYHSMKRKGGVWVCDSCSFKSKDAHLAALSEYALLIKPTITNQELRRFLHIPSPSTANKLITSMNLSYTGETKGRVYNLLHGRNSFLRG